MLSHSLRRSIGPSLLLKLSEPYVPPTIEAERLALKVDIGVCVKTNQSDTHGKERIFLNVGTSNCDHRVWHAPYHL